MGALINCPRSFGLEQLSPYDMTDVSQKGRDHPKDAIQGAGPPPQMPPEKGCVCNYTSSLTPLPCLDPRGPGYQLCPEAYFGGDGYGRHIVQKKKKCNVHDST